MNEIYCLPEEKAARIINADFRCLVTPVTGERRFRMWQRRLESAKHCCSIILRIKRNFICFFGGKQWRQELEF